MSYYSNKRPIIKGKKGAERIHSNKRFEQRFGTEMTDLLRSRIVSSIKRGDGIFLGRRSRNRTKWRVWVDGLKMDVVYDKQRKEIVTVIKDEVKKGDKNE